MSYASSKTDWSNSRTLAVVPTIGYFYEDNMLLGLGIGYDRLVADGYTGIFVRTDPYEIESHTFILNPHFTRYLTLAKDIYFSVSLNLLLSTGRTFREAWNVRSDFSTLQYGINLTPGIAYQLKDRWIVMCQLGNVQYLKRIETLSANRDVKSDTETFGFDFGLNTLAIGVQYFLKQQSK